MQAAELIRYMENPALLDQSSVGRLQQLVKDFPYFQPAHILLSMASKKWDASVYQQSLKKTAIVVSNRSHLFNLIHSLETVKEEVKTTPEPLVEAVRVPLGVQTIPVAAAVEAPTDIAAPVLEQAPPALGLVVAAVEAEKPVEAQAKSETPLQSAEETRHELDILKAAELLTEATAQARPATPESRVEEEVEKEMGRQLVSAYIEKEVLDTPALHKPAKKEEEPASFNDWLSLLRSSKGSIKTAAEFNAGPPKAAEPLKEEPRKEGGPEATPAGSEEVRPAPDVSQQRKQKNKALIDKIIESSPGHIRVKEEQKFFTPDTRAKESLQDNEHLVTETLARIYALQGNVNKAIRAYEILSLKFPQKSAYFATLIQKLKNN